jgi:hypothetical protein
MFNGSTGGTRQLLKGREPAGGCGGGSGHHLTATPI